MRAKDERIRGVGGGGGQLMQRKDGGGKEGKSLGSVESAGVKEGAGSGREKRRWVTE
jgi:hypothetical protein